MMEIGDGRGVLYPARLPCFLRLPPPKSLAEQVAWFWVVRWQIASGQTSRQELLPFPMMNLVIQSNGVSLSGPTTGASHRELRESGWAVAALVLPAAARAFVHEPRDLLDREVDMDMPQLHGQISSLMDSTGHDPETAATQVLSLGLRRILPQPEEQGLLANRLLETINESRDLVRVEDLAAALNLSVRSVQRLALKYLGLSPLTLIRRYRLLEAAQRLREDPSLSLVQLAAELQYTDQAHLSADFRKVLGFTPSNYRRQSSVVHPPTGQ